MRVGFCAAKVVAIVSVVSWAGAAGSPGGTFVQPFAGAKLATWYEIPNAAAPACSSATAGAASTPRVEKKFAKWRVGPAIPDWRPPTQSTCATFFPARSAAAASVSAWSTPAAANDVELAKASPVRWKVLFVEPCSLGQVPVMSVYQPTPVFGGKACSRPFAPRTPASISALYAGMTPCDA